MTLGGKDAALLAMIGACAPRTGLEKQVLVQLIRPAFNVLPNEEVELTRSQVLMAMKRRWPQSKFEVDGRKLAVLSLMIVCGELNAKAAQYATQIVMPVFMRMNMNGDTRIRELEVLLNNEVLKRMNRKKWSEIK